jgi:hypothetical protein
VKAIKGLYSVHDFAITYEVSQGQTDCHKQIIMEALAHFLNYKKLSLGDEAVTISILKGSV